MHLSSQKTDNVYLHFAKFVSSPLCSCTSMFWVLFFYFLSEIFKHQNFACSLSYSIHFYFNYHSHSSFFHIHSFTNFKMFSLSWASVTVLNVTILVISFNIYKTCGWPVLLFFPFQISRDTEMFSNLVVKLIQESDRARFLTKSRIPVIFDLCFPYPKFNDFFLSNKCAFC